MIFSFGALCNGVTWLEAFGQLLVLTTLAMTLAACGKAEDTTPPVGALQVSLSRPKVALGSPVEVTYKFTATADAPALGPAACSSTSSTRTTS